MGDPTYSYTLKKKPKDSKNPGYYLYITRIWDGVHKQKYIGSVTAKDKRVQMILQKRAGELELKILAAVDAIKFF